MPKLRAFELEITPAELQKIKDKFEENAGILLDSENMPDINLHPDGECSYCHYKKIGLCPGGRGDTEPFVPISKFISAE